MDFKKVITDTKIIFENEQGEDVASVEFVVKDGIYYLEHTNVSPALQGKGVASKLLEAFYELMSEKNAKAQPVCSYAVAWFNHNEDKKDVLASL